MKFTVMEVFEQTAEKYSERPAIKFKRDGRWVPIRWSEYRERIRDTAKSMLALGLERKKGVSIIGFNCPQWTISNFAAIYAGGCPAGIYTTNSAEQCKYIARHAEAQLAIVENEAQLAKFLAIRDQLPELKAIVMMNGDHEDENVYSWEDFLEKGKSISDQELQNAIDVQKPDDVCTYIYTSGTTGDPKAVMISHDNITWITRVQFGVLGSPEDGDRMISYLPLSHIAEQIVTVHGPAFDGGCTYFAESIDALGENLREVQPTIFVGVPRVWEKIQAKMEAAGKNNSWLKKQIAAQARKIGLEGGYALQQNKPLPLFWSVADKLVFSKVKQALGLDQCRIMVTSAAPISMGTLEFFLSLGIPIMEAYGMSESTGPTTFSSPGKHRTGWAGKKLPGTELKIAEDGEICIRGRHVFAGYFKNETATAEVIDDEGWLHTGDIGTVEDGFLKITDRKKDIIITAGGENIAPQVIEGKLKEISVISQAVVVGDRRKHLAALLTIDESKLTDALRESGSQATSLVDAVADEKLQQWLMAQVNEVNRNLAQVQTIKKIKILPRDLSIDGGELTPTMKVKRKFVNSKYSEMIEAFYA